MDDSMVDLMGQHLAVKTETKMVGMLVSTTAGNLVGNLVDGKVTILAVVKDALKVGAMGAL